MVDMPDVLFRNQQQLLGKSLLEVSYVCVCRGVKSCSTVVCYPEIIEFDVLLGQKWLTVTNK